MYTTVEAVQTILARDVDQWDSTAANLSTGQLEDAITSAGHEVNARLSGQYRVPFADHPDTPPLVAEITRDIAAFLADLTWRQDVDYTSENEPMLLRHRRAQSLLDMLATGTIILTGVEPNVPVEGPSGQVRVVNSYSGNLFGLEDFDLGPQRGRYPQYPTRTDW